MEEWFKGDEKLKLAHSDSEGKYLVAKTLLTDDVLLQEVPYVFNIEFRYCTKVCRYCCHMISPNEDNPKTPLTCPVCEEISYCSKECESADAAHHSTPCVKNGKRTLSECDIFYRVHYIRGIDNETTLDELKLTFQAKIAKETKTQVLRDRWEKPAKETKDPTFLDFSQLASNNSSFTEEENEFVTDIFEKLGMAREMWDELLTIHHQCMCNAYCITAENGLSKPVIGRAIYIKGSFFNHSCRPNVFFQQKPGTAIIQFLPYGTVKEGEPLHVSYVTAAADLFTRQEALLEDYKFVCRCVRCEEDREYYKTLENGSQNNDV